MSFLSKLFGGGSQPKQPKIAKDSLASISTAKILYGLAEGEISGLVDGAKSIKLDDTPLLNDSGTPNFVDDKNNLAVKWDFRAGSNYQDYIKGFPDVSNEKSVGIQLRQATPYVRQISDVNLSAIVVRVSFGALREQKTNGDITGTTVKYRIELMTDSGSYQTVIDTQVSAKTSAKYERSHRIDLPKANSGWLVKVTRITADSTSDLLSNSMSVEAITEIIDVKLSYPNTAMLGIQYDARTFSNIAKLSVRCRGKLIKIPSNYNPDSRQYNGIWDGTFITAYSNNPAWVFYDLCLNWRYGLGKRIDSSMIDKWALYQIARYCDEMVSDGKGGTEPRFSINVYLQSQQDAFTVLQSLSSIFRGMAYWSGEQITVAMDAPQTPVYTFSRANVVDGVFNYTGTRARDRHTVAKVAWDNPQNDFKTEYEFVRDEYGIAKYGINQLDINLMGCTSQGQAQRAGLWALKSEQLESRQVSFNIGLDGMLDRLKPSAIIAVSDEVFAGRANGGRIVAVSSDKKTVTLDRAITASVGDTLIINNSDGVAERQTITVINATAITVQNAFDKPEPQHIWAIDSDNLRLMLFKIISIKQNDDLTHTINAIQHEPQKYAAVDSGAYVKPQIISIVEPNIVAPPDSVVISQSQKQVQGQNIVTMTIGWSQVKDAVAYQVEWKKDDGNWLTMPPQVGLSVDIEGVYAGYYLARVSAINAFELQSLPKTSMLTQIFGKLGKPPSLASLTANGILFGMELNWAFAQGSSDTNYTEIQVATAPDVNVSLLAQYAYPTNKATIQGLQGNLTQYYRGRIVDKLGNTSDWTGWVKGVTSADAQKVLDLLNGQITESQLYKDLGDKIGKIAINEQSITKEIKDRADAVKLANDAISKEANNRDTAIRQEIADRKKAVSDIQDGVNEEIRQRKEADSNIIESVTSYQTSTDNKIATAQESINIVTNAQSATATKLDGVYAQLNPRMAGDDTKFAGDDSAFAGVWSEMSARIEGDTALSTRIDTITANWNDNLAYVRTTTTATADSVSALASKVTVLSAAVGGNVSLVMDNYYTSTTTDQAIATKLEALKTEFVIPELDKKATAQSVTDVQTSISNIADKLNVQATKVDGIFAQVNPRMAGDDTKLAGDNSVFVGVWSEQSARIEDDVATGRRIDNLQSQVNDNYASITTQNQTLVNADKALATRIDSLQTSFDSNVATINNQLSTLSTAKDSQASSISNLQASVNTAQSTANTASGKADNAQTSANTANAAIQSEQKARADADSALSASINTVQTTVGQNTASIQTQQQSINGLNAQYTIKLDVNGRVSGFGLASSNAVSDFAVRADKFYIAPPNGTGNGTSPFMVLTSSQNINGTVVPAGTYLQSAFIANGSIDNAQIKDGAITNAKIGNAQITTAKIGNAQVDTLQIAGEAIIVPRVQFTPNQFDFYSIDTEEVINSITLDAKGGGVSISFGFEYLSARVNSWGKDPKVIMRIKRDGMILRELTYRPNTILNSASVDLDAILVNNITIPTMLDTPPSGEHTYQLTLMSVGLNAGKNSSQQASTPVSITARSLHIMGAKR